MEKFNNIVADIFKMPAADVRDSLTAKEIPNWDSMNYLLFIAELEKQFCVSFTMDEVLQATTLGQIKTALQSKGVDL